MTPQPTRLTLVCWTPRSLPQALELEVDCHPGEKRGQELWIAKLVGARAEVGKTRDEALGKLVYRLGATHYHPALSFTKFHKDLFGMILYLSKPEATERWMYEIAIRLDRVESELWRASALEGGVLHTEYVQDRRTPEMALGALIMMLADYQYHPGLRHTYETSEEQQAALVRAHGGNPPIGGTFTISTMGRTSDPLPHDATLDDIDAAIERMITGAEAPPPPTGLTVVLDENLLEADQFEQFTERARDALHREGIAADIRQRRGE